MNRTYSCLSIEQNAKILRNVDEIGKITDAKERRERAKALIDFLYMLEAYSFITPRERSRYLSGLEDAAIKN